jgi:uncharacterized NAD-dependent epimerase/dehydratase family protein
LERNLNGVKTAVVLARGQFRTDHAKTAHGLILHGRRYKIVAVIDRSCAGRDAGEVMGIGKRGIPIVSGFAELDRVLARQAGIPCPPPPFPRTLIIGVAPTGGLLPPAWRQDIREAIRRGMDIVSGLHDFLSDDPTLARLAESKGVRIQDVRRPPKKLALARGHDWPVPVVLTSGTDCAVGKRTVTIELHRAARKRGIDAAFVATGQTGVLVGSDAGAVIDHVPGDFMSGAVERMIDRMVRRGKELIFVQGQASLTHHAYGPVTLGILYGSRPHYIVLVHEPGRKVRPSFPDQPVLEPMVEAALVKMLSGAEPVGISLNCAACGDRAGEVLQYYERRSGLPAVDVLQDGPGRLLDALLGRLAGDRRFRYGPGLRRAMRRLKGGKEGTR